MKRINVRSSNLKSVGYEELAKILEIEFHDGRIYQYFDVPSTIYQGLISASSKGTYLDRIIKKGPYQYQQIV